MGFSESLSQIDNWKDGLKEAPWYFGVRNQLYTHII